MHNIMAVSILVWLPTFLMRTHNITEAKAGMTVGIISLMAIIGSPLGGIPCRFLAEDQSARAGCSCRWSVT